MSRPKEILAPRFEDIPGVAPDGKCWKRIGEMRVPEIKEVDFGGKPQS